jgi:pSer/pThr/pTyr-binding forkhead associated (FHA) protein
MSEKTTQFRRTVSGTLNSGMRSVFGSEGRRYFIIEHKDDSSLHSRGEQQKLIVDEVFIGRDSKCQVRIDEKFGTVSREHAMIVKAGDDWKLIHRSQTNQTYVNGQQVQGERMLQNGDEIQLSANGPRLGFIVPQGEQSLVKSIGLTARLNLFRQQALRPYKTALAIISAVALLAIGGLIAWNIIAGRNYEKKFAQLIHEMSLKKDTTIYQEKLIYRYGGNRSGQNNVTSTTNTLSEGDIAGELVAFEDAVFFVRMTDITVSLEGQTTQFPLGDAAPCATGFINSDGYFITARHVIEPWAYFYDLDDISDPFTAAAIVAYLGGTIDATIVAESKNGDRRTYHYTDFTVTKDRDKEVDITATDNNSMNLKIRKAFSSNDYAFLKTNTKSNLVMNKQLATNLPAGTQLDILGFPYSMGGDKNNIRPQYTFAHTSNSGLYHGQIAVTGFNAENGNSGGPVFCKEGDKYYVVGVVSSSLGNHGGIIVPVSSINY